ncbi:MAG: flagellar hook-basal body complex protein [Rhodospirillales bacterium]
MSLFGAMQSGVSGLTSQASAMGGISDNIANVSTIGYKRTQVNFQTLVTAQTSRTLYSPGGVQSKPRQDTGVQGLLKGTSSSTDLGISGGGFFVVNQARQPGINDEYVFTRAGSFFMDKEGYLRNTAGYYMQAWPTDARGNVIPANRDLSTPNQGVITTDYMETINLRTIGSSAAATDRILASANLPSGDNYDGEDTPVHRLPVEAHDSLGGTHNLNFEFSAWRRNNTWDIGLNPAQGVEVTTLLNDDDEVYRSVGQLEFEEAPPDGATVVIAGRTYEFNADGSALGTTPTGAAGAAVTNTEVDVSTLDPDDDLNDYVAALVAAVNGGDSNFDTENDRIRISEDSLSTILFTEDGTSDIVVSAAGLLNDEGVSVTRQTGQFTVRRRDEQFNDYQQFVFGALPADGDTMSINGATYEFDNNGATTTGNIAVTIGAGGPAAANVATTLANLETAITANDPDFSADTVRVRDNGNTGDNNTLVLNALADDVGYQVTTTGGLALNDTTDTAYGLPYTLNKLPAVEFNRQGRPIAFNVTQVEMKGFDNGAADMDGGAGNSERIDLDFGRLDQANGLTQLAGAYNKGNIQENGKEFGIFNGLVVSDDGKVTVKFTNGDKRTVYQIPIATFANTNQMGSLSGNVWNQTEDSGDYTLRRAGLGIAGKIKQASLEQSNVDIGHEFTEMIVVQRAYSAAARIISTSDEMLEELMRTKR